MNQPTRRCLPPAWAHQHFDPASLTQIWTADANHVGIETEESYAVQFRDDLELTSGNVYNQSAFCNPVRE